MLERFVEKGARDACAALKLATGEVGMLGGLLGKAKAFGQGQLAAGKSLLGNLRGGLGGAPTPEFGQAIEGGAGPIAPGPWHREQAMGNLKTLAPSLLAGGGLYMMHRRNQAQQEQQRQQAMAQQSYGQPMM